MTIKELIEKGLPLKVKLNSKFTLEESVDVGTIISVLKYEIDSGFDGCYKLLIKILKEDLKYNLSIATNNWYNPKTKEYDISYYESNKPDSNGDYVDTIYVMENDDCFDLVDEFSWEQIADMLFNICQSTYGKDNFNEWIEAKEYLKLKK